MTSIGAIVLAETAARTAHTLDNLARHAPPLDGVTGVAADGIDARVSQWLQALTRVRGWTFVVTDAVTVGGRVRAGLDRTHTDWFLLLDAGEALAPGALTKDGEQQYVDLHRIQRKASNHRSSTSTLSPYLAVFQTL